MRPPLTRAQMAEENGVQFRMGRSVSRFEGTERVARVVLDNKARAGAGGLRTDPR